MTHEHTLRLAHAYSAGLGKYLACAPRDHQFGSCRWISECCPEDWTVEGVGYDAHRAIRYRGLFGPHVQGIMLGFEASLPLPGRTPARESFVGTMRRTMNDVIILLEKGLYPAEGGGWTK